MSTQNTIQNPHASEDQAVTSHDVDMVALDSNKGGSGEPPIAAVNQNNKQASSKRRKRVGKRERATAKRKLEMSLSGDDSAGAKPTPSNSKRANNSQTPPTEAATVASGTRPSNGGEPSNQKKSKKTKPEKVKSKQAKPQVAKPDSALWRVFVLRGDRDHLFTTEEQKNIEEALNKGIQAALISGTVLRSNGVDKSNGRFIVKCADQATADWLSCNASETLEVLPYEERPRLQRCTVHIPNLPGLDSTLESTFTLLKGQNSGVQTDKWVVYSELNKESGKLLIFGADKESMDYFKSVNYCLFYGAVSLKVNTKKTRIATGGGEQSSNE
jgi:hypothetical protein